MISRRLVCAVTMMGVTGAIFSAHAASNSFDRYPDSLVLKDGRVVRGLIVKNSVDSVLMQEEFEENLYPKSQITRIRDEADIGILFTDINRRGSLPTWRVIANDLRTHDEIKSLVEIPATVIDNGEFKNVPYKSFRVNESIEMNIYGDPENPAGVEIGIYGSRAKRDKLRRVLRAYLAGFLTTKAEVAALYGLPFSGGLKAAGDITLEITPADAPDAYGAWWISLYNRRKLAEVRLDDREYARLVRPVSEIIDKKGRVIANGWSDEQIGQSEKVENADAGDGILLRGFYRDDKGDFRLIDRSALTSARKN
jgi:hypothetical protein